MLSKTTAVITLVAAMELSPVLSCSNFEVNALYSDSQCQVPVRVRVGSDASGWTEAECSYSESEGGYTTAICSSDGDALAFVKAMFGPAAPFSWVASSNEVGCSTPSEYVGVRTDTCIKLEKAGRWAQVTAEPSGNITEALFSDSTCTTKVDGTALTRASGECYNSSESDSSSMWSYETNGALPTSTTATPTATTANAVSRMKVEAFAVPCSRSC
jgi:hypothetical protein